MRATTVLLVVAVVASTTQAVKIRGSRRKYIVDKPIQNLTPAQKEYFLRLLWLMKNVNGPVPNLGHDDPELKNKLANGGFYYDDDHKNKESETDNHLDTPGEEIQQNLESDNTSNTVLEDNSLNNGTHSESEDINSNKENENTSSPSENPITDNSPLRSQESINVLAPYLIFDHESVSQSKSNESEGSNAVESNSHSNEIDIRSNVAHDHEIDDSSQNNENQGFYVVNSGKYNSHSEEIDSLTGGNDIKPPFVVNNDGHNIYYGESDINSYENGNPSKNNERPGSYDEYDRYSSEIDSSSGNNKHQRPYVVDVDEYNIYSKENDINGYQNVSPSKRKKQPGSHDEYDSYSSGIDDSSESNKHKGRYVVYNYKYNSYWKQNDKNNYPYEQPYSYDEYKIYSNEIDDSSGSNDPQRPPVVYNDKYNSYSEENDVSDYENVSPYKPNKKPGSYDEYEGYSSEIEDSSESNEHRGPYAIDDDDKHNSYSEENYINHYDDFNSSNNNEHPDSFDEYNSYSNEIDGSSESIEQQRPYIIHVDKHNSYSKENKNNNYPNKDNEQPDSYDEYNSYYSGINDAIRNNGHQGPFIIDNDRHNSYSKENEIKQYENDDGSIENNDIERPDDSLSDEDGHYSSIDFPEEILPPSEENYELPYDGNYRPNKPESSEEDGSVYNKLDPNVQQTETDENIRNIIEDELPENNIYEDHNHHHRDHHHANSLRHRKKPKPPSDLPQYIIKPDQSFKTIKIIPAPRLTSLVIKMCDKSETNVLEVWKKVAKRLGLDSDFTFTNIHHVKELLTIIKTFVVLSKNKNFLNMPLNEIVATIRDKISNGSEERSVETSKNEDYDDHYNSEDYSAENGLRELDDSSDFHVETSLKSVELSDFLKYVLENQKDSHVDADESDNSDSLISDESNSKVLSEESTSDDDDDNDDDVSNDRRILEVSDYESTELPIDSVDSEPNNLHESNTNVLDILPGLDIISLQEEHASLISGENSYVPNDDENEVPAPYTPNLDITMELPISDINDTHEPAVLEDTSEFNFHENGSEANISEPVLCPVIKEPSSNEDHDVSKDLLSNLIPYIMGTNINEFILPFMENSGQCRNPIHKELLQKVKEIIELLQKAECF